MFSIELPKIQLEYPQKNPRKKSSSHPEPLFPQQQVNRSPTRVEKDEMPKKRVSREKEKEKNNFFIFHICLFLLLMYINKRTVIFMFLNNTECGNREKTEEKKC